MFLISFIIFSLTTYLHLPHLIRKFFSLGFLPFSLWIVIYFLICIGVFFLINYTFSILLSPEIKLLYSQILRLKGVRWLNFLLFLLFSSFIVYQLINRRNLLLDTNSLISLAGAISFLMSFLGIDYVPELKEEEYETLDVSLPVPLEKIKLKFDEIKTEPDIPSAEIAKNFIWQYNEKEYQISALCIRREIYEELKSKERVLNIHRWGEEYVSKGIVAEIHLLAKEFIRFGMNFGTYHEVGLVLSFVQSVIKYKREEGEYPKYPIETLVEGEGDCEDSSFLGAAILKAMGYEVVLLEMPGHIALGIAAEGIPGEYIEHDGIKYYYCEMTSEGWKIGQIPEGIRKETITIIPIPPTPPKIVKEVENNGSE